MVRHLLTRVRSFIQPNQSNQSRKRGREREGVSKGGKGRRKEGRKEGRASSDSLSRRTESEETKRTSSPLKPIPIPLVPPLTLLRSTSICPLLLLLLRMKMLLLLLVGRRRMGMLGLLLRRILEPLLDVKPPLIGHRVREEGERCVGGREKENVSFAG